MSRCRFWWHDVWQLHGDGGDSPGVPAIHADTLFQIVGRLYCGASTFGIQAFQYESRSRTVSKVTGATTMGVNFAGFIYFPASTFDASGGQRTMKLQFHADQNLFSSMATWRDSLRAF